MIGRRVSRIRAKRSLSARLQGPERPFPCVPPGRIEERVQTCQSEMIGIRNLSDVDHAAIRDVRTRSGTGRVALDLHGAPLEGSAALGGRMTAPVTSGGS